MLKLVSANDHPRPAEYPAESLQLNEQEEANAIAEFIGARFVFAAGIIAGIAACLVSEIVILLIVKGVSWS